MAPAGSGVPVGWMKHQTGWPAGALKDCLFEFASYEFSAAERFRSMKPDTFAQRTTDPLCKTIQEKKPHPEGQDILIMRP